ncbi:MAG: ATP-binding protein [Candidatus Gastranaerophilales bacterium]|nr:ATP-binding protein [Candidatus Gastranaerophilales bacterium]
MRYKRLKIVEQIIIISLIGVLVPSVISWFVINNISQHSLRKELGYSAQMLAKIIENNIFSVLTTDENRLEEIVISLNHISGEYNQNLFLKDVSINSKVFKDFEIIHPSENENFDKTQRIIYEPQTEKLWIVDKIHNDKFIKAEINSKLIKDNILNNIKGEKNRRIYVVDTTGNLVFTHNYDENDFKKSIKQLPVNPVNNIATRFEEIKNQPRVYLKMDDLGLIIIVNTSEELTKSTIIEARLKILIAFLIAAAVTMFLTLMYSYYLYFNIRQLFKGIISVSRGNYKRQIVPITNIFTPREIIFLSEEFNSMISEINASYKKLQEKNKELKLLDGFRSNLVDTVSHELRTPLTSIRGYTSRLLRTDIKIDEATKHKSLLIIKQQSERLSRMIEDLLVIPDIEGAKLNINLEPVNLLNIIENSIYSVKNIETREIENNIPNDFPLILSDKDRLEQVIINLLGNANKYAYEDTPIKLNALYTEDKAIIEISNSADYIDNNTLSTLFDKFIRLDDKTTRTTRGTGLGLYIVKGLVNAMQGEVILESLENNTFIVRIILNLYNNAREKIES